MRSQIYLTLILFKINLFENTYGDNDIKADIVTPANGTFFYYAYGSNLLAKRLHIHNPSAVFYSIAKLKEMFNAVSLSNIYDQYLCIVVVNWLENKIHHIRITDTVMRLDFNMYSESWNGAVATIVEDDDEEVWGSLWTIDTNQLHHLDEQEGLAKNWYFAKNVTVTTPKGEQVVARTYEKTLNPNKTAIGTDIPLDRRPSNTYLEVIALGAIESHLPAEYIGFLFSFPTNGKMAPKEKREELGYPF